MNPYKEWNCGDTTVQYNKLASDSYEIAFATLFKSRQLENGINFKTLPNGGASKHSHSPVSVIRGAMKIPATRCDLSFIS
jgi:hypothetical protein